MLPFDVLYDFPPTLLEESLTRPDSMKQPFLNLITTMKRCSSVYCPPVEDKKGSSEEEVMLNIIKCVMVPLLGEVEIEKKYTALVENLQGVRARHIGIGHPRTFHGTPDMRVRGCDIIWTPRELEDEEDKPSCNNSLESEDDDKC